MAAGSIETLIVLDQDETLVHSDRQLIYRAVRSGGRVRQVRYEHRRSNTEPILSIPDAFAWCWAKGGHWRSLIQPLITTVEVCETRNPSAAVVRPGLGFTFRSYCGGRLMLADWPHSLPCQTLTASCASRKSVLKSRNSVAGTGFEPV